MQTHTCKLFVFKTALACVSLALNSWSSRFSDPPPTPQDWNYRHVPSCLAHIYFKRWFILWTDSSSVLPSSDHGWSRMCLRSANYPNSQTRLDFPVGPVSLGDPAWSGWETPRWGLHSVEGKHRPSVGTWTMPLHQWLSARDDSIPQGNIWQCLLRNNFDSHNQEGRW